MSQGPWNLGAGPRWVIVRGICWLSSWHAAVTVTGERGAERVGCAEAEKARGWAGATSSRFFSSSRRRNWPGSRSISWASTSCLAIRPGDQLSEFQAQLGQISTQVKVLQDSVNQISTDLAALMLEGFEIALGQIVSKITALYKVYYVPALDALTSYVTEYLAAGGVCGDGSDARSGVLRVDGHGFQHHVIVEVP